MLLDVDIGEPAEHGFLALAGFGDEDVLTARHIPDRSFGVRR